VDVHLSSLYRARKLAQQKIYGKLDEQYHRLWDYCAMVRKTNVGSCLILMVERPVPEVPCRFQRLYVSFAVMKTGFLRGCRPVIGVDTCFLKGRYKGMLMVAVGRDANNRMCNTPSPLRLDLSPFFFYNKSFAKIHKVYQST
jgi:hypothetical protein